MDDNKLSSIRDGRIRGGILTLVRLRHKNQQSRMDHVELWHMLRGLGFDVGENDIITFLQDLGMIEAIKFIEDKDRRTNRTTITQIELCRDGLRILEGKIVEDSVLL